LIRDKIHLERDRFHLHFYGLANEIEYLFFHVNPRRIPCLAFKKK
jgi:hypothetical protein